MGATRESAVAGTFYPSNPEVLKADINGYLSKATFDSLSVNIVGLITPHAGYMYSGQTAAYGYRAISGSRYDTIIIVAPSHQSFFFGAAVQDKGAYKTPLGIVSIDEDLAGELVSMGDVIHADPRIHRESIP